MKLALKPLGHPRDGVEMGVNLWTPWTLGPRGEASLKSVKA
jgi:hypothetical protein